MPRLIDLGEPYGRVSFPDDATDDQIVSEYEKLETDRLRALKEARLITARLADIATEEEPSLEKTLVRTGLAMREGAAGGAKQMVGNVARTFADIFSRPQAPLQRQADESDPELPLNILREAGRDLAEEGQRQRREAEELGEAVGGGVTAATLESLGGTAGLSAPALLAAPLGMGPAAVAAGLQTYGITVDDFKDEIQRRNPRLTEEEAYAQARIPAGLAGVATGLLTRGFGGVERFVERIARDGLPKQSVKELLRSVWRGASLEFPEEFGDQLAQGLIEKAFVNPEKPIGQIFNEAGMAGLAGFVVGGATISGLGGAGQAAQAITEKITEPSRMRRGTARRREVISREVEEGRLLPERISYAERTGVQVTPTRAEAAPVEEAAGSVRVQRVAPDRVEAEAGAAVTPLKAAPVVYRGYQPGFGSIQGFDLYNLTETLSDKLVKGSTVTEKALNDAGFAVPEEEKAKADSSRPVSQPATETAAGGRSRAMPEIATPATPVSAALTPTADSGRTPMPEAPAPTPAAATSESGTTAPVTAGAEPPAATTVPPETATGKDISEQSLTTERPTAGYDAVHSRAREKFEAAWVAKDAPAMKELLHSGNKVLRAEFSRRVGRRLPRTASGTRTAIDSWVKGSVTPEGQPPAITSAATVPAVDARIQEIRARRSDIERRLRAKFGQTTLNVDPEIATIAAELALNYAEEGVVRFSDFAGRVKSSMPEVWERLKHYLRGAWTTASDIHDGLEEVSRADARAALEQLDRTETATPDKKAAEEEVESQIIRQAREIAIGAADPVDAYRQIVELYQAQPRLGTRTVTSKTNQAYSTPAPLAYLAGRLSDLQNGKVIAEPTAGNGMLLIGSNPAGRVLANELDSGRLDRLRNNFPSADISRIDASSEDFHDYMSQWMPDRAVMNPPFGGVIEEGTTQTRRFLIINASTAKAETPSIDLAIALNTLDALTPDGKAVVLIGAKTGSMSAQFGSAESRARAYNRPEMLEFFKRFNVVDWFTVDGSLYEKMGAGWPVDVIVIDGKHPTPSSMQGGMARPWVTPPQVFSSWDALETKLYEADQRARGTTGTTTGRGGGGTETPGSGGRAGIRQGGVAGGVGLGGRAPAVVEGEGSAFQQGTAAPTVRPAVVPAGGAEPAGSGAVVGPDAGLPDEAGEGGEALAERTAGLNVPYVSVSKNADPKLVVPANIADAMRRAVQKLETEVRKTIDAYVAEKMGWTDKELFKHLSSAQIEAVGLFIRNSESRRTGLINSDQTGVGKGRVVASVIEYARRNGKIPIFITQGKHLYSDMAGRDLPSIGVKDFTPFITDSGYVYQNGTGDEVAETHSAKERRELMQEFGRLGALPAEFDGVFSTYFQLQADKPENWKEEPKARFKRKKNLAARPDGPRLAMLRKLAPNAIFILDEAHQAAGLDSDVGLSLQSILRNAAGVFYASATFAKRPDNLTLYSLGTGLKLAGLNAKEMAELFKTGGVPMQQALTTMLAEEGEFVRREQDMSGVKVSFKQVSSNAEEEAEKADTYTSFLRDLHRLSDMVNAAAEAAADAENQVRPEEAQVDLTSVNFGARLFNLSNQYLFSLRADSTALDAIEALGRGQKPFIAVYNTMAGPIADLVTLGLPLNFGGLLRREMARMLELKIKDPSAQADPERGLKKGERLLVLKPEDLPDGGEFFRQVEAQIQSTDFGGMPISPIDAIKKAITQAGYKVGEITAREGEVDETGGVAVVSKREKRDRNKVLSDYNNAVVGPDGRAVTGLDVLIVNGSGSTGLSAHTDPKFKDHRQRYMIVAQAAPDINVFMQMLGRVMRFGQTSLPEFAILTTRLAAERRFMTMLRGKLTSLNANTTADTESGITQGGLADDIFNRIGDEIVAEVIRAHPDLAALARIDLPDLEEEGGGLDNYARYATGRFVLLPNDDAARLWKDISELYVSRIRALDEAGENPLKANVQDLRAQVTGTAVLEAAKGRTAFDGPVTLDRVNIRPAKKPYGHDEASGEAGGNEAVNRARLQEWMAGHQAALRARLATMEQREMSPEQMDRTREAFRVSAENVAQAASLLGTVVGIDPAGTGSPAFYAIPTAIELRARDTGDFSSSSKHTLKLATNTLRRTIHLPLSQLATVKSDLDPDTAREAFESSSETTTTRYIAGTNLLRAFSAAGKLSINTTRPSVTMYTMRDGQIRTGVLLGAAFNPEQAGLGARAEVVSVDEFVRRVQGAAPMVAGPARINGNEVRVPAGAVAKSIWGDRQFPRFFRSDPVQRGNEFVGTLGGSSAGAFFDFIRSKGLRVFESAPAEQKIEFRTVGKQEAPDAIDAALTKAIEATDPLKPRTLEGITGAPVWLTLSAANGALRVLRAAYRAGRTIADAIAEAVAWLRTQGLEGFNAAEAQSWLALAAEEETDDEVPTGGALVEGAAAEVGRVADGIVKRRESAAAELDGLAYERQQFKAAKTELKRLSDLTYGRFGATLQEEPVIVPDPRDGVAINDDGQIEVDDSFTNVLREAGVEHSTENVKAMQGEVFFEGAAARLNHLLAKIETLQGAVAHYQQLKADPAEIDKIIKSISRLNARAARLGEAEWNGMTVSQRASEVRSAEAARPARLARRNALSLDPVSEFFGRQVGAYRRFLENAQNGLALATALRDAATSPEELERLSKLADRWGRLPEDVRSSLLAGKPLTDEQRASAFATLAEVFDDFDLLRSRMAEMQANRAPEIARESAELLERIATVKIDSGTAEVMIADVLAALDGETGGTGTLQSQAVAKELQGRLTAIQNFALSVGRDLDTNRALFEWLANPTDQPRFVINNAAAYGTTPEVIQMILAEVKRNPDFGSAIVTLVESANRKLASLPITQLETIEQLVKDGKPEEAAALASRLISKSKARASLAESSQRANLKRLDALDIERQTLNQGVAMFDELAADPEFQRIRADVTNSPFGLTEPMVAQNNTTTTFKAFGGKGTPSHDGLELRANDSVLFKEQWHKRVAEWHVRAQEYLDAYHAALALHNADPAGNPSPASLGFDPAKVRGLKDATERFVVGSFLDLSLLSESGRWKVPAVVRHLSRTSWFRQHEFAAKMVGGQAGFELRGRLGDFINNYLASKAVIQKYNDIPDRLHKALRSHPELAMNMADYRVLWNEMAHWGRLFGSPLKVGFTLPLSGKKVTAEDMALLRRQRQFEEDLRRRVTETNLTAGVRLQRGGRELVRPGAYVGDEGLPRHLNRQSDSFIADILRAYAPDSGRTPNSFDSTTDLSASSTHPAVAFWNQRLDLVIQHVLDARRGDRAMRLGPLMQQAEANAEFDWRTVGKPAISSLDDIVNQIVAHFPPAPGINVRDAVIEGLNDELRQYRDAASRIDQERRERAQAHQAGVTIAFSADNEFTRPAAKLELPSAFYDYGALTTAEHLLVSSRANHERIVAYATALQRAIGDLRNRLVRFQNGEIDEQQAAKSYGGDIEEMKQVLGVLQLVASDFEAAYRLGNPALSQRGWFREGMGLLTSAVLALPTVNLRNMSQGQFEVYLMSQAMGLAGHRMTMWRALKNMVRTVARYALHVGGGAMKRLDLGLAAITGKNAKLFETLVDHFATLVFQPDYKTSAQRVMELGYDSRAGFLDRMKRIWQETAEISDRSDEAAWKVPGTQRKLAAVLGVPHRALQAAFNRIGVQESDLTINAALLNYAEWLNRRLEEVADVYGRERERMGLTTFDFTDPRWTLKPDEWASFPSAQQNADSLGLFRLFIESAASAEGFQLERGLWDFYQSRKAGQRPKMFTERQFDAVTRKLLAEFNAATPANRASAAAGNNVIRNLLTLQGYVSDGLLKLINSTMGGARDRNTAGLLASKLAVVSGLALMAVLIGYFVSALTGEWERRVRGRAPTLPTPLDKDFWTAWNRFGENTLRLSLAQLFYVGDMALAMRGEVQGNRGFDPVGRVFPVSVAQRLFNTMRGMWTTQGTVGDKLVPMADFGRSMVPWALEMENVFGNAQGAIKQGERVLRGEAQVQGLLPEKRGQSFQGPSYGPTTVIRRRLGEAASAYWRARGNPNGQAMALADAQEQIRKLREFYEAKYVSAGMSPAEAINKAESDVWRDYQEINPAVAAMLGKRPTAGEWNLIRGGMSGARAKTVDDAVEAWKTGARVFFGREGTITREEVAAARTRGDSGGGLVAGIPSALPRVSGLPRLSAPRLLRTTTGTSRFEPVATVAGPTRRVRRTRIRRPRRLSSRRLLRGRRRSPRITTRRRIGTRRRINYLRA